LAIKQTESSVGHPAEATRGILNIVAPTISNMDGSDANIVVKVHLPNSIGIVSMRKGRVNSIHSVGGGKFAQRRRLECQLSTGDILIGRGVGLELKHLELFSRGGFETNRMNIGGVA
jgi:hypothetical protein